jgi:hypothetical protein
VKRRLLLTIATALTFFAIALNSDIYNETSPPSFAWHVLLRKIYSVGAFALIGFIFSNLVRACNRKISIMQAAAAVGAYSACIEVGQAYVGSHEGLGWNAFDTACGALGGAIGYVVDQRLPGIAKRNLIPKAEDKTSKRPR